MTTFSTEPTIPVRKPSGPTFVGIDPKLRPVKNPEQFKFVVATDDNQQFRIVNINEASTVEEAKIMISNSLNIQEWALCTFHLTDFGCTHGQTLDDNTFDQLLFSPQKVGFSGEILKLYVYYDASTSPSSSYSLDYTFGPNSRQYPSTPAYMIHQDSVDPKGMADPLHTSKALDYFSPKPPYEDTTRTPVQPLQQQPNPYKEWQHFKLTRQGSTKAKHKGSDASFGERIRTSVYEEDKDLNNLPIYNKSSLGSLFENNSRRSSEDSFKVIRPERREINFDDRRASPYDRRPSFNPRKPSIPIQTGTLTRNAAASAATTAQQLRSAHSQPLPTQQYGGSQNPPTFPIQPPAPQATSSAPQLAINRKPVSSTNPQLATQSTQPTQHLVNSHSPSISVTQQSTLQSTFSSSPSVKLERQRSHRGEKLERTPSQLIAKRTAPPPPPATSSGLLRAGSKKGPQNFDTAGGMAKSQTTGVLNSNPPIVPDSSAKIARQVSTRKSKPIRITSGPPKIDLGDFHSFGELGLGFDDIQNGTSFVSSTLASTAPSPSPMPDASQDTKFHENEISFDNAPELEESDDDSSSDEGLWAKKPPSPTVADTSSKAEETDQNINESKQKRKPELHVLIKTPSMDTAEHFGQAPASPLPKKSGSYLHDIKLGGWAVRPPAEVVYENLERFFPDADLDRPIVIDPHGPSPPASPNNDNINWRPQYRPPLSPVVEPPKDIPNHPKSSSESLGPYSSHVQEANSSNARTSSAMSSLNQAEHGRSERSRPSTSTSSVNTNSGTSYTGVSASTTPDVKESSDVGQINRDGVSDSTGNSTGSQFPGAGPKTLLSMRTKSLRIVVREASERRRRYQSLVNANNKGGTSLVRRKSTKMWGQKVVEVKPSEIQQHGQQLSRLQDNRGKVKQFVWVKGELIGKGSFGKVYLALNVTAGEMIAVKQVEVPQTVSDKSSAKQKEMIDTLHAEVETMKDLDHFNIVQYLGFEALPDFYNLFLEYVPGGSVGSALRKHGRFEEKVIKSLTKQVLDALSYLHSRGILHRDLKSDNLLIDLDGVCKISDFGISKKSRDIYTNDAEMSMQGTIFWMAPEVIHNVVHNEKQGYSAKVDIWSFGCVVLEMFAGRRPWSTDEAIGAMYKLGNARLAPPIPEDTIPFVSSVGKDIIDKCFTINPDQRPTALELLNHPFCNIPPDFRFQDTQLAQMIRVNDKRKGK